MHNLIPFSVCIILWGLTKDEYQKARWHMGQSCHTNAGLLLRTYNESTHLETSSSNVHGMKQTNRISQPSLNSCSSYILTVYPRVSRSSLLQAPITTPRIDSVTWVPHIQNSPFSFLFLTVVLFEPYPSLL